MEAALRSHRQPKLKQVAWQMWPLATSAATARAPRSRLEPVAQTDGVAPREGGLRRGHFAFMVYMVLQTDGVAPREAACDAVFRAVSAAGAEDPIIFNCQMGAGRTTTGMVIACLVRTFTTGAPGPRVACEPHPGAPSFLLVSLPACLLL